ncbi:uncharacterized protein LOC124208215 isoform X3 [Daphnia pulex]|uniref:uncharacterized protein LOC124208215 isoform X3 n=1 Tax=Daphnia pulex TaxID=6669 RepID=UPI001EDDEB43|nr:uncharacterized protein LOC124208215 isoform X3 [Daphnia pulex]
MDHHQLSLSTKMPKIVSEDVQINEDNCIDDKKEYHQEKAEVYNLEPLPAWMTLADETCMNELISTKDYSQKTSANQGILISQVMFKLAPEELCLEDVQQLQKLNRELQADNIKKTLSYMMLEQDYYSLKDEVAVLRKDLKHWQECSGLMKLALRELYSNRESTVRYGTDEMPELLGVKFEESIEQNFSDEVSSPPKSSSLCPIELVDLRHQHVNQPQSFSEFPSVTISAEMSQRKSLSPVNSVNAMKQLNEIRRSPLNDVSHCPTGMLVDLSEDTAQSQASSVLSPVSDEMSPGIKSPLKKYDVANSEDEFIPCTRKDFPYCSTEAVKPPRRSVEVDYVPKETSPHKKLSSPFKRIIPEEAKSNFKDPPKYYFPKRKEFKCDVCDLYLNSQEQMFQHFKGSRHKVNSDEERFKNN